MQIIEISYAAWRDSLSTKSYEIRYTCIRTVKRLGFATAPS